jgi:thiamine kinase-like enzyme
MAPSNNHITDDQVYLLDFEYGDFRHALYDLTAWYMLCPLPETLVQRLIDHYAKEICPAIHGSDETFEANWNLICAWRGLALLSWIPQGIIQENRPWVDEWSMREAVLITLHRLHIVCSRVHELLPLAEHVGILSQRLQAQWSEYSIETCLPRWSVFQRQPPSR